jgi:hypothetical protein
MSRDFIWWGEFDLPTEDFLFKLILDFKSFYGLFEVKIRFIKVFRMFSMYFG